MTAATSSQETPAYPQKLFYRINEVAQIVGVEAYVLRYWETKFPMLRPERLANDERRYRQRDVDLLLRIRQLVHREKYTIAGAVDRLRTEQSGRTARETKSSSPATQSSPTRKPEVISLFDQEDDLFSSGGVEKARAELGRIREELVALRESL